MSNASRPNNDAMVEMLHADPAFADEYLAACMEAIGEAGSQEALVLALRHVIEAKGIERIAERAGLSRESLYRSFSSKGNPTLKTILAVLGAAGLRLSVTRNAANRLGKRKSPTSGRPS